ncbi:ADP-heptose--LPS heptosyltransferase 2 [Geobacter sp. OR-1]|uniref:glycosyltransferase family 9 protein n=1 Tax=Geobacter sp. OR-1 TaxID=1266765 RepID=UPI000541FA91|nr:glycosyltransferase family 9 protein [Geobacter sp. OR-1]GAM07927.1 ADP-heptose--LPS heptosyltransferase 2 [Geobacter sp. OR-1]
MILQRLNMAITSRQLKDARWLAIGHPMALGDVVASLPLAGIIKRELPHLKICFVGSPYARPVIECCEHIDAFLEAGAVINDPDLLNRQGIDIFLNPFPHFDLAVAAFRAGIPIRVGNLRRRKVARLCNRFVFYSRRRSGRHEIELNLENLAGIGLATSFPLSGVPGFFGLTRLPGLEPELSELLDPGRLNIIFHPKSSGNGREWPASHFLSLARMLPPDRFRVFVSGVEKEGATLRRDVPELFAVPGVVDLTGRLSLRQFLAFIARADGLVASGTGPLHLAAALGIHALGIFPPRVDIDPAHWAPIGVKGEYLCLIEPCHPGGERCPDDFPGGYCACTAAITPEMALERVLKWQKMGESTA